MIYRIDKKSIKRLYLSRNAKSSHVRSSLITLVEIGNPYLTFMLYAMFQDMLPEMSCPAPFGILMESSKIVSYMVGRIIGKDVAFEPREERSSDRWSESDYIEVMRFLLSLERTNRRLSYIDQPFILYVVSKISETEKAKLIRFLEVSPLCILVMKTMSTSSLKGIHLEVITFLKAKDMEYEEGFKYVHESSVDFRALKRVFLRSNFPQIQNYFHALVDFCPEMMFGIGKPYTNRMEVFGDPLLIPIKPKLLCAYISACVHFIKRKYRALEQEKNLDVLIKTIYIERILSACPKKRLLKKVIHQMILDTPILVKVIVMRRFPSNLVKRIVRCVPSFHLAYEMSLRILCKNPNDNFYETLVEELLKKYPTESNVKKFGACSHLLSKPLLKRLKYLTDACSSE
ncbi:hypothetical protein EHEL_040300 [Encephalitozoon hellem ATCC 50504]|uniref:Uncharacterized protein n=1 Tax=Encephalitozoon hellem TaxID=27973 RepID=A0A9Q9F832_ENCHE|nr:uncharacterized protein EHEL_040300 [Encephalitozoon hellem ATCC 50504]AFM98082.1 hypothetical protein EHEL_040300 [Encephalitozoon hellem ATCC 50504]UTX42923.1 hypothetical protein GPU96_04g06530 [Encephalitozoon hellem]|eukprot:XP_003887063.1 hypothetical protein EHEL_040300 [Encephalitozoon hellem ATCC 50504]